MSWKHWEVVIEVEDGGRPFGKQESYLTAVELKKLIEKYELFENIGHLVTSIKEIVHDKESFTLYERPKKET